LSQSTSATYSRARKHPIAALTGTANLTTVFHDAILI
jgi:hypothetical protein